MSESKPQDDKKTPSRTETVLKPISSIEKMEFENHVKTFLFSLGSKLMSTKKIVEFEMLSDNNFSPKNVGLGNFHLFMKLPSNKYLHLKIYGQHMLESNELKRENICVSLKIKDSMVPNGCEHLPVYNWYKWDADNLFLEIEKVIDSLNSVENQ